MKNSLIMKLLFALLLNVVNFSSVAWGADACVSPIATTDFTFATGGTNATYTDASQLNSGEDKYYYLTVPGSGTVTLTATSDAGISFTYGLSSCPTTATTVISNGGSITISSTADVDFNFRVHSTGNNRNFSIKLEYFHVVNTTYYDNNLRNFTLRNPVDTRNIIGDIATVGNTVQCLTNRTSSFGNSAQFVCNPTISDTAVSNNNYTKYIDIDSDTATFNSSAATLALPAGSTMVWAGLYWQGFLHKCTDTSVCRFNTNTLPTSDDIELSASSYNANKVKFKVPGATAYRTITASTLDYYYRNSADGTIYSAFADVTEELNATADGKYYVGNVQSMEGKYGYGNYGAWSLFVIYRDPNGTLHNNSVYDGFKVIFQNYVDIPISGFYTPSSGTVSSRLLTFAGEGEKNYFNDYVSVGGGTNYVSNPQNPTYNVFNSTISGFTPDPVLTNYNGIDIDSFDTSAFMTNSQTSTTLRIGSTNSTIDGHSAGTEDAFYPSVLAFSVQLYQPQVCYYEQLYKGTTQIKDGAQVNYGDTLNVKVYVTNKANETAEKVKVYRTFDTKLPYVESSTGLDNTNPPYGGPYTYISQTDSSDSDQFDYNASDSKYQIRLGTGATSVSGGNLLKNQGAAFDYNITVKSETNTSIEYNVAYTNTAINFDYVGQIGKCVDFNNTFWGYNAPQSVVGDFNVVYADHVNGALTSGYYYNLPTQITSRADNYKVISLDSNTLKDINTTVAVELVDADSSVDCSTMTRISGLKTWVSLYNTNKADLYAQDIIDGMILYDADAAKKFYQKAGKNVKFRISYPVDGTGGNIIMNETVPGKYHLNNFPSYAGSTCVYPVTATTYNPANGNPQGEHTYTQVPEACGNAGQSGASAMTQHEVNVCLECIYGASVNYVCSRDNFAIRPEGFFVKLNDQNQTNSATKQFMMNNTPSPANQNMASGYRYYMEVNATNHLGDASSLDYNTSENVDFVWNSTQTGCNDDTNKSISFSFANGLADGNVSVNQVGEYRLSIIDSAWAAVDSNTSLMTHHTGSYFMGGEDCAANSAVSSAVKTSGIGSSAVLNGCNISTNHTNSVAGVTYTDSDVTFHPYKFDMSTINFGVGLQPQEINATSGPDFVYMSDMSRTDSMNMSVRATGTISARGENNSTLSNFVDNCYAVNTNLSMNTYNNITLANTDYQVRFVDSNGSGTVYDSNATNVVTSALSIPLMTLNDGNFTKDMSGSLNTVTRLNYDRNQTTPLNPMTVQYGTLGFKCVTASECTMQADLSGSHEALGSRAMDFNVTHIYGRIIPRDVRVFGNVPFVANAWYEGYNIPILNGASLEASKIDAMWYANSVHTDANDGDGNVTVIIPTSPLALPTHSSSTMGMETYQFSAIPLADIPYSGKAHINTDPWLWYGINALNYADPVNSTNLDCLTHPCFNITVVPSIGATGSAKSTNEATKASKKTDSGGGTWKSTSDYAPAIR